MLNEDERNKGIVMAAIRCGESDDEIRSKFEITTSMLTAIKTEYEEIKNQLDEMRAVSEIAEELQCSEEFVEEVRRIKDTSVETLSKEVTAAAEHQPQKAKPTGKKDGYKATHIDQNLKNIGDEQTAAVLVSDAGDIAKAVAIQRQDIGKLVTEVMGTVAMQFGYKDQKQFLLDEHDFWLKYQGRVREMEALIEELTIINQQLQDALERDMIGVLVAKKMDSIICLVADKPNFDPEKLPQLLIQYKKVLASDPVFLKQLYDAIHSIPADSGKLKGEVEDYAT